MPRRDIRQVEAVARLLRMTILQRQEFGRYIEEEKRDRGMRPSDTFPFRELLELGELFMDIETDEDL